MRRCFKCHKMSRRAICESCRKLSNIAVLREMRQLRGDSQAVTMLTKRLFK